MALTVEIPGRMIVGSGVVVLDAGDRQMTFNLDGMVYRVQLFPSATPEPLTVQFRRQHLKHVDIDISGQLPLFSASWKMGGIGYINDDRIDLDLMIFSQSDQPDCVRQVTFTFTVTRGVGAPSPQALGLV
jgi:hypothetical protein